MTSGEVIWLSVWVVGAVLAVRGWVRNFDSDKRGEK